MLSSISTLLPDSIAEHYSVILEDALTSGDAFFFDQPAFHFAKDAKGFVFRIQI